MRVFVLGLSLFGLVLSTSPVLAEEISAQKKAAIEELLEVTGAANLGQMLGKAFTDQMIIGLKENSPKADPKIFDILTEEVDRLMEEELVEKKSLLTEMYPIYDKYLSLEETRELISFYKSPVGKKAIAVMPQMSRESMRVGQLWGESFSETLHKRFEKRLEAEGLSLGAVHAH